MKVNVLMPVYNGEKYLREAIESILNQTYKDFTFIIIDDGSTDQSVSIIDSYSDNRIKFYKNTENLKLISTLNKGLALCDAEYIVRMDADDISLPTRIEEQVKFMDANPEVVCSGTWFTDFDETYTKQVRYEISDAQIQIKHLYQTQIAHPTAILRNKVIKDYQLKFDFNFPHCEDYEFWTRLKNYGDLANLPKFLVKKREHQNKVSNQFACIQIKSCIQVKINEFKKIGVNFSESEIILYEKLAYSNFSIDKQELVKLANILKDIVKANQTSNYLNQNNFEKYLKEKWFHMLNSAPTKWKTKQNLMQNTSELTKNISFYLKMKMRIKSLIKN